MQRLQRELSSGRKVSQEALLRDEVTPRSSSPRNRGMSVMKKLKHLIKGNKKMVNPASPTAVMWSQLK